MKRIQLGQTGTSVAAIGLGCAGMSHIYGPADREQSLTTLRTALDNGIEMLDTADAYGEGHNEELIGAFLRDCGRGRALVATKFGRVAMSAASPSGIDNSPAYIAQACDASLRRLGLETIDLYYMHRRDPRVPLADSIGAMARLVEAGKVRWLGMSEVSPATLRAAHSVHPISALQSEYSLWSRDPEGAVLDTCRELGITLVAFAPLGRAFLTGAMAPDRLGGEDYRSRLPRFQGEAAAQNLALARRFATLAQQRGVTPAQLALAWLLARNDGTQSVLPIPGTKRPRYVLENVAAGELQLEPAELAELDAMFPPGAVAGGRYTADETLRLGL
ncbi:MAG TPA: aldo/keto reductase [Beijerinckiaceae bacterium]|jgi:aryl-alcohol dehydrogenase-like predicted oxidoreductase